MKRKWGEENRKRREGKTGRGVYGGSHGSKQQTGEEAVNI